MDGQTEDAGGSKEVISVSKGSTTPSSKVSEDDNMFLGETTNSKMENEELLKSESGIIKVEGSKHDKGGKVRPVIKKWRGEKIEKFNESGSGGSENQDDLDVDINVIKRNSTEFNKVDSAGESTSEGSNEVAGNDELSYDTSDSDVPIVDILKRKKTKRESNSRWKQQTRSALSRTAGMDICQVRSETDVDRDEEVHLSIQRNTVKTERRKEWSREGIFDSEATENHQSNISDADDDMSWSEEQSEFLSGSYSSEYSDDVNENEWDLFDSSQDDSDQEDESLKWRLRHNRWRRRRIRESRLEDTINDGRGPVSPTRHREVRKIRQTRRERYRVRGNRLQDVNSAEAQEVNDGYNDDNDAASQLEPQTFYTHVGRRRRQSIIGKNELQGETHVGDSNDKIRDSATVSEDKFLDKLVGTEKEHTNSIYCGICGSTGMIVCCDFCYLSYHLECLARNPHLAVYVPELDNEDVVMNAAVSMSTRRERLTIRRRHRRSKKNNPTTSADTKEEVAATDDLGNVEKISDSINIELGETSKMLNDDCTKGMENVVRGIKTEVPSDVEAHDNGATPSCIDGSFLQSNAEPPEPTFDSDSLQTVAADGVQRSEEIRELKTEEEIESPKDTRWRCPKCSLQQFIECRPHHRSYRRTRFKHKKWLALTAVTTMEIPNKNESGIMIDLLVKYKKTKLTLNDLRSYDCRYSISLMAQDAVLRGVEYLFNMCEMTEGSKQEFEKRWFIDYGCEVAWLLTNLLDFCDDSTSTVREACAHAANVILEKWYVVFDRHTKARDSNFRTEPTNVLCLLEAVEAERALDGNSDRWRASRDKIAGSMNITEFIKLEDSHVFGVENVCPNCNGKISKSPVCGSCNFHLQVPHTCINYRRLTDTLVWANLFGRLELQLPNSVDDMLLFVRRCRPWRSCNEIGLENFRLQLYLLTHVVFILTRWGKYRLSPQTFPQEYLFLRVSLAQAICLDDPELVGELVQSLRLFGVPDGAKHDGRWVRELIDKGIAYLLDKERRYGTSGRWVAQSESLYQKMHATYCALLGLSLPRRSAHIPEPDELHYEWWRIFSAEASIDQSFPLRVVQDGPALSANPTAYLYREDKITVQRSVRLPQKSNVATTDQTCDLPPDTNNYITKDSGKPGSTANGKHITKRRSDRVAYRLYLYKNEYCLSATDVRSVLNANRRLWQRLLSLIAKVPNEVYITNQSSLLPSHDSIIKVKNEYTDDVAPDESVDKLSRTAEATPTKKEVLLNWLLLEILVETLEFGYFHEASNLDTSALKNFIKVTFTPQVPPPIAPPHLLKLFPDIITSTERSKGDNRKSQRSLIRKEKGLRARKRSPSATCEVVRDRLIRRKISRKGIHERGEEIELANGGRLFSKRRNKSMLWPNSFVENNAKDTLREALNQLEAFCRTLI